LILTKPITIIGAGAWGTALAIHIAGQGRVVRLWGHDPHHMERLKQQRLHPALPNQTFPASLEVMVDWAAALSGVQDFVLAVPSHAFRAILEQLSVAAVPGLRLLWVTKGLDPNTHQLLHTSVQEFLGEVPMAVLSGPSFAIEVARGLPTAVAVAGNDIEWIAAIQAYFHTGRFRLYTSLDMIGVQLGGVVKNVLAIAVGMSDGMQLGANARSALITRGLAEMTRLGAALQAQAGTLMGLSGLGDLVLTCTDNQSRNRRLGICLGEGQSLEAAKAAVGHVIEGAQNVGPVMRLAAQHGISMPICEQVYAVFHQKQAPQRCLDNLISRPPTTEGL